MPQLLLFPDPRPLVERLGLDFFRCAPESAGVYLMRDRADTVVYVGKAKNLRKRLGSYRVANPDRLGRRHLRLLRAVERIELRPCPDEPSALANESALLRTLRPRFNRAGTWPGTPRFLAWRLSEHSVQLALTAAADPHWHNLGPLSVVAAQVRAALARLLWCAVNPKTGVWGLPEGWFSGRHRPVTVCSLAALSPSEVQECSANVENLLTGRPEVFADWIIQRTASWTHRFDLSVRDADLEILTQFAARAQVSQDGAPLAFGAPLH